MNIVRLAAGLVLIAPAAGAAVPTDNPQVSGLDRAVHAAAQTFFADSCHVGLSIAVHDQGRDSFYNYGTVSKARPALPTRTSLYEIGSITKSFTGVVAARALNDGTMTLDGDFRRHLKGRYPNLEKDGKPVTLRTLAAHTSGMPRDIPANDDLFKNPDFETLPLQLIAREKGYDRDRYLTALHETQLNSTPGDTISYSNIGIKLIGFGLENAYGKSYAQLLDQQVFTPLAMSDSSLKPSWFQRHRLVQGYGPGGKPAPHILTNAGAAAGILSTTQDMIKYAAWQLDEGDPVIKTAHTVIHGDAVTYGEAMMLQTVTTPGGARKFWQSGGVYGMSSQMVLFPDSHRAYVLLANDACFDTQGQLDALATAVHGALDAAR